jgi:hypothetical protein
MPENTVDKRGWMGFIEGVEMNTTFSKQIEMRAMVNDGLTRWQHTSCPDGVVGTKT